MEALMTFIKNRRLHGIYQCQCGKLFSRLKYYIKESIEKYPQRNISCGCQSKIKVIGQNRTGYGFVSGSVMAHICAQARHREIEFNLTAKYLSELLEKQNFKCALTGEQIQLPMSTKHPECEKTASLDRIDNSKGYIEGNVQWTHKIANRIRHVLSIPRLFEVTKNIYKYIHQKEEANGSL